MLRPLHVAHAVTLDLSTTAYSSHSAQTSHGCSKGTRTSGW